jgi:hypothetical protein
LFHPKVHEEQAVFEYYIEHYEEVTSLRAKHHGEDRPPELFKHHGDVLRQIYAGNYADLQDSYFIDKIIDRAHQVDDSSPSPFEEGRGKRDYISIATHLASLPRSRRAYIGKAFLAAIKRAGEKNDEDFAQFSSHRRRDCLLFLASPRPQAERKERNEEAVSTPLASQSNAPSSHCDGHRHGSQLRQRAILRFHSSRRRSSRRDFASELRRD